MDFFFKWNLASRGTGWAIDVAVRSIERCYNGPDKTWSAGMRRTIWVVFDHLVESFMALAFFQNHFKISHSISVVFFLLADLILFLFPEKRAIDHRSNITSTLLTFCNTRWGSRSPACNWLDVLSLHNRTLRELCALDISIIMPLNLWRCIALFTSTMPRIAFVRWIAYRDTAVWVRPLIHNSNALSLRIHSWLWRVLGGANVKCRVHRQLHWYMGMLHFHVTVWNCAYTVASAKR